MSPLVSFDSDDGHRVLVEVEDLSDGGRVMRGARAADAVVDAGTSLEHTLAGLGPTIDSLVTQVRSAAHLPDEIELELGVRLSADANLIIARSGGEANFRIAMKWTAGPRPAAG